MTYQSRRFEFPSAQAGRGHYVADQINQFLAYNPTLTPVDLSITWRRGRSRSDTFYLTLAYRNSLQPSRMWAVAFQSTPALTAEDQATAFFTANPQFLPVQTVVITPPDAVSTSRRLLIIYGNAQNVQLQAQLQTMPAAALAAIAAGDYGTLYDVDDFTRAPIQAINLGNQAWPAGGTGLAFVSLDNSPDQAAVGGIPPCCYAGATFTTPAPYVVDLFCGKCIDPEIVTVSFTTVTTTTTTVTTTTSTTTTSTTTTSTSTTSTTTTTVTTTTSTTTTSTTTTVTTTTSTTTTTSAMCNGYSFGGGDSSAFSDVYGLPPSACGGSVDIFYNTDPNAGSPGVGAVVTVTIDGVPTVLSCQTNGGDNVVIPPGASSVTVAAVFGCNGGPITTFVGYSINGS